MGVIVNYTCKHCGFIADEVFVGPGWASTQVPVLCQDCGRVSSTAIDDRTNTLVEKYATCRHCGSKNIVVWDNKCPRCGSEDFDEECVGMWD